MSVITLGPKSHSNVQNYVTFKLIKEGATTVTYYITENTPEDVIYM